MILIADAGSTKIEWAVIEDGAVRTCRTGGCNALTGADTLLPLLIDECISALAIDADAVSKVEYYGAGCATGEVCDRVAKVLRRAFPGADILAGSDLIEAAKALFGDRPGIACILGTGSNSGLYDGSELIANVAPLGYILGDDGSGAALGKRLVREALRGDLDPQLSSILATQYGVTKENVLERVYKQPGANTFLASLVPFLADHRDHSDVRHILIEEFTNFFQRNVDLYDDARSYPLGFVGSVALHFSAILQLVAHSLGYVVTDVIGSPLEHLARRYNGVSSCSN